MSKLSLDYDAEPFEFISKVNSIHKAFETLNISTDDILQYFMWTGLNETFKSQLIYITNDSKPSLELMKSKFLK